MFRFFDLGPGILTEKISGPWVTPGGMVTGVIDTCIMLTNRLSGIKVSENKTG